jgi:hypothetical protein
MRAEAGTGGHVKRSSLTETGIGRWLLLKVSGILVDVQTSQSLWGTFAGFACQGEWKWTFNRLMPEWHQLMEAAQYHQNVEAFRLV